mmetsp:Transcript_43747/g.138773  ORF Transcript_43747/g.138773 Transcript_43747/m.138773 type:complete len:104 (-) Transcript_43747:187-498(-)
MGWGNKSPGAAFAGTAGSEGEAAAATEAQGSAGQRLPMFCRTLSPGPQAEAPAPRQLHHARASSVDSPSSHRRRATMGGGFGGPGARMGASPQLFARPIRWEG